MKLTVRKHRLFSIVTALAALAVCRLGFGESLADRAPADAIGFVSWAGTDALGKPYEASHLKGLMDVFNLPQFIAQHMQDDMQKHPDDPQKLADAKAAQEWLIAVSKAPTALYFGGVDFTNVDSPMPKVAIYSQIGKDKAAAFAPQINAMIEREKKDEKAPPVVASAAGDFLLLTIGELPDFAKRLAGAPPADGLSTVAGYQETLAKVGADKAAPAALVYVDGEAALKLLDDGIAAKGGMGGEFWPKIEDAMGITAIRHVAFAGNFDGANWSSQSFLGLADKRAGYMAFFDNKPLTDDVLKLIPKSAAWAGVLRLDGPRLMQDARDAMTRIDPQNGAQGMDQGLQQFFLLTGVDLQKDLLDTLGDSFVYYGAPDAKGSILKSATIANKLKDGEKAEAGLTALEAFINTTVTQRSPDAVTFKTETLPAPNDKVVVHVISTPVVSPAWAIHEGVLYISMSSAGIQSAIEGAGKAAPIMENPQFVEMWKAIGQKEMSSFQFTDLSKMAAEAYPLAVDALAKYNADHPDEKNPFVLPPLEKITPNLGPVLTVYWSDKDGFHSKSKAPLPLVESFGPENIVPLLLKAYFTREAEAPENGPMK